MPRPGAPRFQYGREPSSAYDLHTPDFSHTVKLKIRYVIDKEIEGRWVTMARLTEAADRIPELCQALGGKIRIQDLVTQGVTEEEYD
jgi:hypothetical protein